MMNISHNPFTRHDLVLFFSYVRSCGLLIALETPQHLFEVQLRRPQKENHLSANVTMLLEWAAAEQLTPCLDTGEHFKVTWGEYIQWMLAPIESWLRYSRGELLKGVLSCLLKWP